MLESFNIPTLARRQFKRLWLLAAVSAPLTLALPGTGKIARMSFWQLVSVKALAEKRYKQWLSTG